MSGSTVIGEIFVASPRDLLLILVYSVMEYRDVGQLRLAEADIGEIKPCVRLYLRSSNLRVLVAGGAGRLARQNRA